MRWDRSAKGISPGATAADRVIDPIGLGPSVVIGGCVAFAAGQRGEVLASWSALPPGAWPFTLSGLLLIAAAILIARNSGPLADPAHSGGCLPTIWCGTKSVHQR
jgi:hypothetical protein